MNWITLSTNEWRRRPLRTTVTASGVAIAVATMFSLLAFHEGYRSGMNRELDRLGAHVLVVPKGCPYDAASMALHGANWPCYLNAQYIDEVRAVPGIASAAPALMSAVNWNTGEAVYVGIDEVMRSLRPNWRIHGSFPSSTNEILAGAEAARRNGWKLGQRVALPGLTNEHAVVAGTLAATSGTEDEFIFMRLKDAQRIFGHPAELTHVLVRLKDPNELDHAVTALRGCNAGMDMNVVPMAHLFRTIQSLVNSTRTWLACIAIVGLLIAAAGVSNTVLMAVTERTREIGVMRALGASRADVFRLFWLQTMQVCLAGAVGGALIAFAASRGLETWLRSRLPFAPADPLIEWNWLIIAGCLALALILGTAAGFLPAWRAAHLAPMLAIRTGGRT